jgi:hypothetical protein
MTRITVDFPANLLGEITEGSTRWFMAGRRFDTSRLRRGWSQLLSADRGEAN